MSAVIDLSIVGYVWTALDGPRRPRPAGGGYTFPQARAPVALAAPSALHLTRCGRLPHCKRIL